MACHLSITVTAMMMVIMILRTDNDIEYTCDASKLQDTARHHIHIIDIISKHAFYKVQSVNDVDVERRTLPPQQINIFKSGAHCNVWRAKRKYTTDMYMQVRTYE